jgi:hypothetical protein
MLNHPVIATLAFWFGASPGIVSVIVYVWRF